jgi:hypothetical protein
VSDGNVISSPSQGLCRSPDGDPAQRRACAADPGGRSEVAEFPAKHTDLKTETGQQRVVRHGHLPERKIMAPGACARPRSYRGARAFGTRRRSCRDTRGDRRAMRC